MVARLFVLPLCAGLALATLIYVQFAPLGAQSPGCVGVPDHFINVSAKGVAETKVYGPVVPLTEVWVVDQAGVYTPSENPQVGTEFMLEVILPLPAETGYVDSSTNIDACCYRIPVAKQVGAVATPFLALTRSILLRPGTRLAARNNTGLYFGLLGTMWKYPASCASTLALGLR